MKNKAVFLDRDGTIHIDKNCLHEVEKLEYFEDTFSALKRLQNAGYILIIVSNQDGIRRGFYTEKEMNKVNEKILNDLRKNDIEIAAIYYSPYQLSDNHFTFKPNPGMLLQGIKDFDIDANRSFIIGDHMSDYVAGVRAGVKSLIVRTGLYEYPNKPIEMEDYYEEYKPVIYNNLTECVNEILKND